MCIQKNFNRYFEVTLTDKNRGKRKDRINSLIYCDGNLLKYHFWNMFGTWSVTKVTYIINFYYLEQEFLLQNVRTLALEITAIFILESCSDGPQNFLPLRYELVIFTVEN